MDRDIYSTLITKLKALGERINALDTEVSIVGDLTTLETTDKSSIVNAINEVVGDLSTLSTAVGTADEEIGTLTLLETTAKTDLVSAINEVLGAIATSISAITAINGVYINAYTRQGESFNVIPCNTFNSTGSGFLLTSAGVFPFHSSSSALVSDSNDLTITDLEDGTFKFECGGQWFHKVILLTTWNYNVPA